MLSLTLKADVCLLHFPLNWTSLWPIGFIQLISCLFLSLKKKKTMTTATLKIFTDHSEFQTYNIVISKQHFTLHNSVFLTKIILSSSKRKHRINRHFNNKAKKTSPFLVLGTQAWVFKSKGIKSPFPNAFNAAQLTNTLFSQKTNTQISRQAFFS